MIKRRMNIPLVSCGLAMRLGVSCIVGLAFVAHSFLPGGVTKAEATAQGADGNEKWALWINGTRLRGANIWNKVDEEPGKLGDGEFETEYQDADFVRLKKWGANYVNFSVPGVFSEIPDRDGKYVPLPKVVKQLDELVDSATEAGLWIVLGFRTGPGRNEYGFDDEKPEKPPNHSVWKDKKAQDGWVEMWRWAAKRYRDRNRIVAYELMVEPNSNAVFDEMIKDKLDMKTSGKAFMDKHAKSLYDWNPLAKRISEAIREVDTETPIIVSTMNWGHLDWLSSIVETKVPRTIYSVHYYEPYPYSSSTQVEFKGYRYPGKMKTDESHKDEEFVDKAWLDKEFRALDEFRRAHPDLPVALTEFGPIRWKKDAEIYYGDVVSLFEKRGLNYAVWIWEPSAKPPEHNNWNFQFGPDEKSKAAIKTSALIEAIKKSWSRNAH